MDKAVDLPREGAMGTGHMFLNRFHEIRELSAAVEALVACNRYHRTE